MCRAVQIQATMAEEIPATAAVTGLGRNPLKCFVVQVLSTFLALGPPVLGASNLWRRSGLDLDRPLHPRPAVKL